MAGENKKNLMMVAHRRRTGGLRPVHPVASTTRIVARLRRCFRIAIRTLVRIRSLLFAIATVVAIHFEFLFTIRTFTQNIQIVQFETDAKWRIKKWMKRLNWTKNRFKDFQVDRLTQQGLSSFSSRPTLLDFFKFGHNNHENLDTKSVLKSRVMWLRSQSRVYYFLLSLTHTHSPFTRTRSLFLSLTHARLSLDCCVWHAQLRQKQSYCSMVVFVCEKKGIRFITRGTKWSGVHFSAAICWFGSICITFYSLGTFASNRWSNCLNSEKIRIYLPIILSLFWRY